MLRNGGCDLGFQLWQPLEKRLMLGAESNHLWRVQNHEGGLGQRENKIVVGEEGESEMRK